VKGEVIAMQTEMTLKRIGFKAGRAEQPGVVAELVLLCDKPDEVLNLVAHTAKTVLIVMTPLDQQLPFTEPSENGTVAVSASRRRRGTRATPTEDE
jgi:hypothetical protein